MKRALVVSAAWLAISCTETYEVFPLATDDAFPRDAGAVDVAPDDAHVIPEPTPPGASLGAMDTNTCGLEDGSAWCWGSNADYALGLADPSVVSLPTEITGLPPLVAVEVGAQYACGLDTEGAVWCWGRNTSGQLGAGFFVSTAAPRRVALPGPIHRLSAGTAHVCALGVAGELWCWGENSERQLGTPDSTDNQPEPLRVDTTSDWVAVSAGQGHTCAIRASGALYCWGRNAQGQLGLGPDAPIQVGAPTPIDVPGVWTQVAADQRITCGIQQPGSLYCWGDNGQGQLGTGDTEPRLVPTRIGSRTDWHHVAVNALHTCALDTADALWCWGRGIEGQLGLGDVESRRVPTEVQPGSRFVDVAVGRFYTCARDGGGVLLCTGDNAEGVLGQAGNDRLLDFAPVTGLP